MAFSFDKIPSLAGKVAIVTGGNSGIGEVTVRELAAHGATVYLGARSPAKAQASLERITQQKGADVAARIHILRMDLADLASIKAAAQDFLAKQDRLDILVNNAGIMATPYELTKDGLEVQNGSMVIGHWLLTFLLLPTLVKTSRRPEYVSSNQTVRLAQVSSVGHRLFASPAPKQSWKTLEHVNARQGWEKIATWRRYGQSKVGNILIANTIKHLTQGERVTSVALHPGNINSDLFRGTASTYGQFLAPFINFLTRTFLLTVDDGALSSLYAATSPDFDTRHDELNGTWLEPLAKPGKAADHATEGKGGEVLRAELNSFARAFVKEKVDVDIDAVLATEGLGPIEY